MRDAAQLYCLTTSPGYIGFLVCFWLPVGWLLCYLLLRCSIMLLHEGFFLCWQCDSPPPLLVFAMMAGCRRRDVAGAQHPPPALDSHDAAQPPADGRPTLDAAESWYCTNHTHDTTHTHTTTNTRYNTTDSIPHVVPAAMKNTVTFSKEQLINIAHININSITADNKIDELQQFTDTNDIKILALTETKLDDKIADNLYTIVGFHSPLVKHRTRHGGGVAIYVHKSLPVQEIQNFDCHEEWIWAKIKTTKFSLFVCCTYLPPNLAADRLQNFIENFSEFVCKAQSYTPTAILVLGDFNTGNIYLQKDVYQHSGISAFDHKLKETADALGLYQIIQNPTRTTQNSNNLRDLLFSSNKEIIVKSGTLSSFGNLDHFPIFASLSITAPPQNSQQIFKTTWDYSRMDIDLLTRLLLDTDWTHILDNDVDTATDQFIAAIYDAAAASIPIKIRKQSNQKPWITPELRRNIRKRDRLFKLAKQHPTDYNWTRWRHQRNTVTSLNRRLKHGHMTRLVDKLITNRRDPHKYHQALRSITGRTRDDDIPPLQGQDGEILTDDHDKATILNDPFASQSTVQISDAHQAHLNTIHTDPVPALENISTNEFEVVKILNSLNINKSTGPDNLPVKVLKLTAVLIAEPLSKLFNKSLTSGIYPKAFKEAIVKPIFKNKGSPSECTNYRPISILSVLSKVFEKVVYRKIYSHLMEHSLLTEKQSGYREHHSTTYQLLYMTHNLYKSLDTGRDFKAIYLDISKYFDKIWHEGLLFKCKNEFGLNGKLLQWLKSYLENRKQKVKVNNAISSSQIINAGCPQGSVLGPLLALIYLNGLSKRTKNDITLFADDTTLYASHTSTDFDATQLSLQQDLDKIYKYGREWAITFNASKTIQQTLSRKQNYQSPKLKFGTEHIPIHSKHKHLGIIISSDLHFHEHINETCHKVNKTLSPLYPIAKYLPRPILDQLYKMYVRPHFDYCDVIYDGHITVRDRNRLETLQNRAARLTTGTLLRTSTGKLRNELGWHRLETRRRIHRLTLYHKLSTTRQPTLTTFYH